jgi:hypothetical protein
VTQEQAIKITALEAQIVKLEDQIEELEADVEYWQSDSLSWESLANEEGENVGVLYEGLEKIARLATELAPRTYAWSPPPVEKLEDYRDALSEVGDLANRAMDDYYRSQ